MSQFVSASPRACLRVAGAVILCAALGGCRKAVEVVTGPRTDPTPAESAQEIEAMTSRAPVRVAWLEGDRLYGFDSARPGEPMVLREARGIERPLLAPDGASVVFTEAGKIHVLAWPAAEDRAVADGFALAVHRDGATREDWVYAAATEAGERVFRFRLHQPDVREPVFDKAPVDFHTAHVSRDGQRLSGRFFGRDSGMADLALGRWDKIAGSRPVALASDSSHLLAMLDGTGRRLRFFHPSAVPWDSMAEALVPPGSWQIVVPTHPMAADLRFDDLRWTNHPRFLLITGSRAPRGRLVLARLPEDARAIDQIAVLAAVGPDVRAADAWVGGGEAAMIDAWPASPTASTLPDQAEDGSWLRWPRSFDHGLFLWSNDRSINQLPDRAVPCRVTPRGLARYGVGAVMLLGQGTFEADPASARAVAAGASKEHTFSIELLLTETLEKEGPVSHQIMALEIDDQRDAFSLSRVDNSLVLRVLLDAMDGTEPREHQSRITPVAVDPGRPMSLVVEVDRGRVTWHLDTMALGEPQDLGPRFLSAWKPEVVKRLVFGDPEPRNPAGWRGRLEKVLITSRPPEWEDLRNNAQTARKGPLKTTPRTIKVRATLREMPELPPPAPGRRFLAQQIYDIEEVLSGRIEQSRVAVWHWTVLDGEPVPSRPDRLGESFELLIAPAARHTELEVEEVFLGPSGLGHELFLDVGTLALAPSVPSVSDSPTPSTTDPPADAPSR